MISSPRRWAAVLLLAVAAASVALTLRDISSALRPAVLLAFFCLVPGAAIVGSLRMRSPMAELALTLGLSLALSTLAGELMLWLRAWDPTWAVVLLASLSAPTLVLQAVRRGDRAMGAP